MAKTNVPAYQLTLALRGLISSDYNTTRASVPDLVWKDYPRKVVDAKSKYPRITILSVSETGEAVSIGNITSTENTYIVQIDVWMWDKTGDPLFVTVDSIVMSGTRARDEIARDVLYLLRKNFYTDANLGYYGYRIRANRIIPFNEKDGILRRSIEIEFKEIDSGA